MCVCVCVCGCVGEWVCVCACACVRACVWLILLVIAYKLRLYFGHIFNFIVYTAPLPANMERNIFLLLNDC